MKPLSILYVEDNVDLRETIALLLGNAQREVFTCQDAEHAVRMLAERDFDVIVTDVSLPGMSGIELARRVLVTSPQHAIVLCSGYEFEGELATLGPNVRSLTKPFEIDDLERLLAGVGAA